jgi:hypothetical protein
VCLSPLKFWRDETSYATCEAPTLSAQSAHYVASALVRAVSEWRNVRHHVRQLADSEHVLWQQHEDLQNILFDDDAFSTSKRYFWTINFLHEATALLDDAIQQWQQYRRLFVEPYKSHLTGREEYWYEFAQRVLAKADEKAENACKELELLRQDFQERLARITVMRDGVSRCLSDFSVRSCDSKNAFRFSFSFFPPFFADLFADDRSSSTPALSWRAEPQRNSARMSSS